MNEIITSRRRSLSNHNAANTGLIGMISSDASAMSFLEDYEVGRKIGEGGFAKVKIATHKLTGEKVAIKIVDKTALKNSMDEKRLEREVHALSSLRHQYICHLYEYHDVNTKAYFIMEYTPRGELFDYIVARQRLSDLEARKIFRQVVASVAYCHEKGFVHRDLKPENILLDKDNNVRLIDFGLVAHSESMENPLLTCCGSPAYAAPELIKGLKYYGPKADMWSLGILLFALLCGYLPFDHENIHVLYSLILSGSFELPTWVSQDGGALIASLLQGDPERRISMHQLLRHKWLVRGYESPGELMSFQSTVSEKVNQHAAKEVALYYNLSIDAFAETIERGSISRTKEYTLYYLLDAKSKSGLSIKLPPNPHITSANTAATSGNTSGNTSGSNLIRNSTSFRLGLNAKARLIKQNSSQFSNLNNPLNQQNPLFAINEDTQIHSSTAGTAIPAPLNKDSSSSFGSNNSSGNTNTNGLAKLIKTNSRTGSKNNSINCSTNSPSDAPEDKDQRRRSAPIGSIVLNLFKSPSINAANNIPELENMDTDEQMSNFIAELQIAPTLPPTTPGPNNTANFRGQSTAATANNNSSSVGKSGNSTTAPSRRGSTASTGNYNTGSPAYFYSNNTPGHVTPTSSKHARKGSYTGNYGYDPATFNALTPVLNNNNDLNDMSLDSVDSDMTSSSGSNRSDPKIRRRRLTLDTISSTLKSAFSGKNEANKPVGLKDMPREIPGNYSADTTTTKAPKDVVTELLRVLSHLKISYKRKDSFLLRCHKRDRMGVLYTLKMDMEVVLIPNTHGHIIGVRFHRIKGDPFEYQSMCSSILFESRL